MQAAGSLRSDCHRWCAAFTDVYCCMVMDPETLYLQLKRLVASMPELDGTGPITSEINQWVGRAIALVEASGAGVADIASLRVCSQGLASTIRNPHAQAIATIVYSALGRAELKAPVSAQGAFIVAGDTLNAFAAVAKVDRKSTR